MDDLPPCTRCAEHADLVHEIETALADAEQGVEGLPRFPALPPLVARIRALGVLVSTQQRGLDAQSRLIADLRADLAVTARGGGVA